MAVNDRWHKSHPRKGDEPCEHGNSRRPLYPAADHGCARRWQVRYRDAAGAQRKKNFSKKTGVDPNTCADAFDAKVRDQVNTGTYINPEDGRIRFAAYAEEWREGQLHREQTRALVERALRLYINPVIGDMPLLAVRSSHVQRIVNEATRALEPSSLEIVYGYVASIFKAAVRNGRIPRSPCVDIRLPPKAVKEIDPLDAQAVTALADALPRRYAAIPKLVAGTGLRPGEVFGLETDCVNFLRKVVRVRQQLVTSTTKGCPAYLGETKTPQSVRTVPVTGATIDMLAAHLAEFPAKSVEIEDRTDPRRPCRRTADLLFTTSRGTPLTRHTWTDIWSPAARAIGLPPRTGLHIVRHTYASAQIRFGESPKTVQKLLGHASPTITMNTYLHLWPDADDRARLAVDAFFADVPSMCPATEEG